MASTPATMLKIVTQGLQDQERLNPPRGNPSVKFYTAVHRPRTRWASRWERVDFDNLADFGRTATVTLPIKGELISRVTLVVVLPDLYTPQARAAAGHTIIGPHWSWTNGVGHAVASQITLLIDGQPIDTLDSRLLEVLDEQETAVEHFESSCDMIARNPTGYTDKAYRGTTRYARRPNQPVEVVLPFWFNRGPGPQAFPIQALSRSKVQISCQFRDVQDLVYTDARVDVRNPGKEATQAGPLPLLAGATFYETDIAAAPQRIYNQTRTPIVQSGTPTLEPYGKVLPGHAMPTSWHFQDAYFVVEYVSLEDREASAFRMADLQIPITQHVALPPRATDGASVVRMPIAQGGLVRDLTLVAQREEATDYNAYFLFSRDLGSADAEAAGGSLIPWWPDARIPNWDYGDGFVRPAFELRRSDPIQGMALYTRGVARFDHDGPSLFRSLIPALGCKRTPLVDRYIYRYDFGFWPTGGLAEAERRPDDEVRGAANWDRLPQKELVVRMAAPCSRTTWETDASQAPITVTNDDLVSLNSFASTTAGFRVELRGAYSGGNSGSGATVTGIVDYQALRRLPGFQAALVRTVGSGSAALVVELGPGPDQHTWIAVAAAGGQGSGPGSARGGDAGDAVTIGTVGGSTTLRQHAAVDPGHGGAGGGRLGEAGVGEPGGIQMPTTTAFVNGFTQTGGAGVRAGGDGYYGGGSGTDAGGGGGSYVSRFITAVETGTHTVESQARVIVTPLRRVVQPPPRFILYSWLTTYNILRITAGRGALMFSA
jgi:hypothetical protein